MNTFKEQLPLPTVIPITKWKLDFYHFANFSKHNSSIEKNLASHPDSPTNKFAQELELTSKKYRKLFHAPKAHEKKFMIVINPRGSEIHHFHTE